jgi:hypothetical protein
MRRAAAEIRKEGGCLGQQDRASDYAMSPMCALDADYQCVLSTKEGPAAVHKPCNGHSAVAARAKYPWGGWRPLQTCRQPERPDTLPARPSNAGSAPAPGNAALTDFDTSGCSSFAALRKADLMAVASAFGSTPSTS